MSKILKKLAEKYQHPEGDDVYEALVIAYNQAVDDCLDLWYNPPDDDSIPFEKELKDLKI